MIIAFVPFDKLPNAFDEMMVTVRGVIMGDQYC